MSRVLICKDNENLLLKKGRAFKYKEIDLTSLSCGSYFEIEDKEDKLVGVYSDVSDDEEPIYTIVTNEFGLYAKSSGVNAKVKISFCDNGMMVVDVIEGAILIKPADDVLLASRGVSELPSVDLDNIVWVNADKILSYAQYWKGLKSKHIQDFEYIFVLSGENRCDLESFGIKCINEETIDISGGQIAVLEAQIKAKEEAKQVRNSFNDIIQQNVSNSGYVFDDDDEDDDDEDDYDEDDYDDGSSFY